MVATDEPMAGRKKDAVNTERIELRALPEWVQRVTTAASRYGLSVSAYIRLAVTERMEQDALLTAPAPRRGRRKEGDG